MFRLENPGTLGSELSSADGDESTSMSGIFFCIHIFFMSSCSELRHHASCFGHRSAGSSPSSQDDPWAGFLSPGSQALFPVKGVIRDCLVALPEFGEHPQEVAVSRP